ncbi:type VI secretion system lipoprotein TssJ [Herbaspirillum robiniae]
MALQSERTRQGDCTGGAGRRDRLHGWMAWAAVALAVAMGAGCAAANSAMGGNSRKDALAEVAWEFAKDGVMLEVAAEPNLNRYGNEPHTLLVGVYQMEDSAAFYKMIADPAALSRSLAVNKGNEGFVQFTRYVVEPGQHSILVLDRAQKAKFIGVVAGYYQMSGPTSARLFEIPLTVSSEGMVSKTWKAAPAQLAARLNFGADAIVNAERLNYDPSEKKMQQAVPLDGGGKEIKLTADNIQGAVQAYQGLKKIGD